MALRVGPAPKLGSSWPVTVETAEGMFFTKLRGSAQGPGALVAEIVVAELAETLGLRVPARTLISIGREIPSENRDEELRDLLRASEGINLGFRVLEGARDLDTGEAAALPDGFAWRLLWLDALVMNPDRTAKNPNLMKDRAGEVWLIDHGAALPFQHNWGRVTEDSPRADSYDLSRHLFHDRATGLPGTDEVLAALLTRETLEKAVARVPDSFLEPLPPAGAPGSMLPRRRKAYEAFLWKRLKAPRPFVLRATGRASGSSPT